ncbi:DNA-binding domain-containing protein [Parazoarcus communis]|nr:putative DNA-binding domain-containing protein [Parazoarcus communis]
MSAAISSVQTDSMQADFACALLDPAQDLPGGLCTWNGSDPARRFAVYRNNVVVSLVDALAETFPVCSALVGEVFFRAMARAFVAERPPQSRVLAFYGRDFPAFVEDFPPAASVPYLADVARLEMLRLEACHAADVEALPAEAIAGVLAAPEQLPVLRIHAHPSVAVLNSRYAVHSLWAAHQGEGELEAVDPMLAQAVMVLRVGLDVHSIALTTGVGVFIEHFVQGAELAVAQQAAAACDPDFDLVAALGTLLHWQIITALRTGDDDHEHTY